MLPAGHTFVVERNTLWDGPFETEPWECAWAREAIFFVRILESSGAPGAIRLRAQLSPDGMHWCDEGTTLAIPTDQKVAFMRLQHFGGWLRLVGEPQPGGAAKVIVYLVLK